VATHLENLERSGGGHGENRKSRGKCVLSCVRLQRVLFLIENTQERSSLVSKVLHIQCESKKSPSKGS